MNFRWMILENRHRQILWVFYFVDPILKHERDWVQFKFFFFSRKNQNVKFIPVLGWCGFWIQFRNRIFQFYLFWTTFSDRFLKELQNSSNYCMWYVLVESNEIWGLSITNIGILFAHWRETSLIMADYHPKRSMLVI